MGSDEGDTNDRFSLQKEIISYDHNKIKKRKVVNLHKFLEVPER